MPKIDELKDDKSSTIKTFFGSWSKLFGHLATHAIFYSVLGLGSLFLTVFSDVVFVMIAIPIVPIAILFLVLIGYISFLHGSSKKRHEILRKEVELSNDQIKRLIPLEKFGKLYGATELFDFAEHHEMSIYHPTKIWNRNDLKNLKIMGNGCSKWTSDVSESERQQVAETILAKSGSLKFLASCPDELMRISKLEDLQHVSIVEVSQEFHSLPEKQQSQDQLQEMKRQWLRRKAARNARSLGKLHMLRQELNAVPANFEIAVYKSIATLRIVIINEELCVVGHYKVGGTADSNKSPLLVFKDNPENDWGFFSGFQRVFDDQWASSIRPTPEAWKRYSKYAENTS